MEDIIARVDELAIAYGRKPKILHIGNIANNAYQNAKMLNMIGYECDVLCNDYYHIGGCPEWDDAEFTGDYINDYYPVWHRIDLNGFKRPEWFIQGPFTICKKYLMAKNKNKKFLTRWWHFWAKQYCKRQSERMASNTNKRLDIVDVVNRVYFFCMRLVLYIMKAFKILFTRPYDFFEKVSEKLRKLGKPKDLNKEDNEDLRRKQNPKEYKLLDMCNEEVEKLFPEYKRVMGKDAISYIFLAQNYKSLLNEYDIVFGYSVSCIFPYLAGFKNYIAYEHGTIRDIPYEDNDLGTLTLLAYAHAKAVYVTNIDCVSSAEYITKDTGKNIVHGLHGIDINRIIKKIDTIDTNMEIKKELNIGIDKKVFFSPTHVDIDPKRKTYLKGNDKMIYAAAQLAEDFDDFVLVLVRIGQDCDKLDELIHSFPKLNEKVIWISPVNKSTLYNIYRSVDAVLDQFLLPGMGSIPIETMCAGGGVLVLYHIPDDDMEKFFGAQMPCLKGNSVVEIYNCMKTVMIDPNECKKRVEQSRKWILEHHSKEMIIKALQKSIEFCSYGEN